MLEQQHVVKGFSRHLMQPDASGCIFWLAAGMIEFEAYLRHTPGKVIGLAGLCGGDPAVAAEGRALPRRSGLTVCCAGVASLPGREALPGLAAFFLEAVKEKVGEVGPGSACRDRAAGSFVGGRSGPGPCGPGSSDARR